MKSYIHTSRLVAVQWSGVDGPRILEVPISKTIFESLCFFSNLQVHNVDNYFNMIFLMLQVSRDGDSRGMSSVELTGSKDQISDAKRRIQDAGVEIMNGGGSGGEDRGRGW